jgi:Flp pilus assembly protein TadG
MKITKDRKGQTLIETALVLVIILMILFGITEFSRAWFTKNSLKNAVRHGVRLAVVKPNINDCPNQTCGSVACPDADSTTVLNEVCGAPGVPPPPAGAIVTVSLDRTPADPPAGIVGDPITVTASYDFEFIIGGGLWPWPATTPLVANATMRHE